MRASGAGRRVNGARTAKDRRAAFRLGHWAEYAAAVFLMLKGYRILARRYIGNGGEIDLIARRRDIVVFVEVKARADLDSAAWSISPTKQQRFARAAHHWQARNAWAANWTLRCDAVLIARWRLPRHVVDAFTLPA